MKRNFFATFAVGLAICLTAFAREKPAFGIRYLEYDGTGAERTFSNYSQLRFLTDPPTCTWVLYPEPCWIEVNAGSNNIISESEFLAAFDAIDGGAGPGNGLISDEILSPDLDETFSLTEDE